MKKSSKQNPPRPARKIKQRLGHLVDRLRDDVENVVAPKAQALFESSAEALIGSVKAFVDFEKKHEKAWRAARRTQSK